MFTGCKMFHTNVVVLRETCYIPVMHLTRWVAAARCLRTLVLNELLVNKSKRTWFVAPVNFTELSANERKWSDAHWERISPSLPKSENPLSLWRLEIVEKGCDVTEDCVKDKELYTAAVECLAPLLRIREFPGSNLPWLKFSVVILSPSRQRPA
jgi:hypothetical protein